MAVLVGEIVADERESQKNGNCAILKYCSATQSV